MPRRRPRRTGYLDPTRTRRQPRAGGEALGRSRGGLTTKVHLVADRRCRPITRIISPGQHADCPKFIPLMDQIRIARRGKGRPRTRPGRAMGDKAYSSTANRAYLRRRSIQAVIPVKDDQKNNRRRFLADPSLGPQRADQVSQRQQAIDGDRATPSAITT